MHLDPKKWSLGTQQTSKDNLYLCSVEKAAIPRANTASIPFFLEVTNQDVKSGCFLGLETLLLGSSNLSTVNTHCT